MARLSASIIFACLIVVSFAVPYNAASACSCITEWSFEKHIEETDLVFRGNAVKTTRQWLSLDTDLHQTRFEVQSALKGNVPDSIIIHHVTSGPSCGITFEPGTPYIILVSEYRGRHLTSSCGANAVWQYTEEFEEAFARSGYQPFEQLEPDFCSWANFERTVLYPFLRSPSTTVAAVLAVIFLRFLWRRRKNKPSTGRD